MRKELLALSLVAPSLLLAQNGYEAIPKLHPSPSHEETPMSREDTDDCCYDECSCECYTPCCCEPCCVPEPKKCIDCECYTPQYYDLQCDWGAFFNVDFLYWYARESNLAYASKVQSLTTTTSALVDESQIFVPKTYEHLDTAWDPGVRIGLGWNSSCDGWDLYLNWTYFQNKEKDSISVPNYGEDRLSPETRIFIPANGECALINPWLNASLHGPEEVQSFDAMAAKWRLRYNNIDLELGRKYWLSKCFTLRPYTGLRGAWTNTKFQVEAFRNPSVDLSQSFENQFTNKYWGVGFVGGIQPNWYFCRNFILFANFEGSLIWGKSEMDNQEGQVEFESLSQGEAPQLVIEYSNTSTNNFFKMQGILDLAIGLRWEETWCCDRYRTTLDLGWEHHMWFNHNTRTVTLDYFQNLVTDPTFIANGYRTFAENTTDTMFGGFVLRARFDF
ncbi:MAG: Lpg1974 family pore-forming outer membrane protein [Simkaniaceae bacterium]|nr:Lpg1974 family pore-forming outer membrane protein [Candidatus Sacchlamyda saccharinae]